MTAPIQPIQPYKPPHNKQPPGTGIVPPWIAEPLPKGKQSA